MHEVVGMGERYQVRPGAQDGGQLGDRGATEEAERRDRCHPKLALDDLPRVVPGWTVGGAERVI